MDAEKKNMQHNKKKHTHTTQINNKPDTMNDENDDHIFVYKRMHFEPFYVANHIHHMQRHTYRE